MNVGVPIDVSDNCYLVHHAQGWFLWDTGYTDAAAATRNRRYRRHWKTPVDQRQAPHGTALMWQSWVKSSSRTSSQSATLQS